MASALLARRRRCAYAWLWLRPPALVYLCLCTCAERMLRWQRRAGEGCSAGGSAGTGPRALAPVRELTASPSSRVHLAPCLSRHRRAALPLARDSFEHIPAAAAARISFASAFRPEQTKTVPSASSSWRPADPVPLSVSGQHAARRWAPALLRTYLVQSLRCPARGVAVASAASERVVRRAWLATWG